MNARPQDPRVCSGHTRLVSYDVASATFTMGNVGGHTRRFAVHEGTSADTGDGVLRRDPRKS